MAAALIQAPVPPGSLGAHVEVMALRQYLIGMDGWLESRRGELDSLDELAQAGEHCDELTPDIALGMSLWQAIKNRFVHVLQVWDNGRVGRKEQEELSALIWGRLDEASAQTAARGLSLPEACKLSDALTGQLRIRLQLDPAGSQVVGRLRDLRAALERLRDQIKLEPPSSAPAAKAYFDALEQRLDEVTDKAGRGGDIGGLIGPLEIEAAKFERDLIVNGALRRQQQGGPVRPQPAENRSVAADQGQSRAGFAQRARVDLMARGHELHKLVDKVVASVANPPKYAVPDVAALGPVPSDADQLETYLQRLRRVDEAMDFVEASYAKALSGAANQANASNLASTVMGSQRDDTAGGADERAQPGDGGLTGGDDGIVAKLLALADTLEARERAPVEIVAKLRDVAAAYQAWLQEGEAAK